MKSLHTVIALAAFALLAPLAANAQSIGEDRAPKKTPSTVSREDVKKEATAQNKSTAKTVGECDAEQRADAGACKKPAVKSTKARAAVKKEAAAAAKAGQTAGGDASADQKKEEGAKK